MELREIPPSRSRASAMEYMSRFMMAFTLGCFGGKRTDHGPQLMRGRRTVGARVKTMHGASPAQLAVKVTNLINNACCRYERACSACNGARRSEAACHGLQRRRKAMASAHPPCRPEPCR